MRFEDRAAARHHADMQAMRDEAKQYLREQQRQSRAAAKRAAIERLAHATPASPPSIPATTPKTPPFPQPVVTPSPLRQEPKKHKTKLSLKPLSSITPVEELVNDSKAIARKRWQFALKAVRSNVRLDNATTPLLGVTGTAYHLEKLDPEHRRGKDLIEEFYVWKEAKTADNFFIWLNKKESATGNYLPRIVYRATEKHRNEIHAEIKEGKLFVKGKPCDTTANKGKNPGFAAFALSADNKLYLTEHKVESVVHASLLGGVRVVAAGMIKVKQGKIVELTNFSGHYQPGLRNLLHAVKIIPVNCFAAGAKIVYEEPRFEGLTRWLKESNMGFARSLGAWLYRQSSVKTVMSRNEFINFAEKRLESTDKKFIHKRDQKGNRFENTLFETHLAKTIIENDETWRPLVLKINRQIYDLIVKHKSEEKMVSVLIDKLQKHVKTPVNKTNFLAVAKNFLLESGNLTPTILFHGDFFEKVQPVMLGEKSFSQSPLYKQLRSDDLFAGRNRGVDITFSLGRKVVPYKDPFYRSDALGVMSDAETPDTLSHYFEGQPGKRVPSKHFYQLHGERTSYAAAQRNREQAKHTADSFREEVIERDVSLVSGASGTTSKIVAPLIESIGLNRNEVKDYLMVRGAVVVAHGHHSMYEVAVLARNLGFPVEYNHRFYHEQFVTKEFRESKAYKDFLESYSQTVAAQLPKPSESEARAHAAYVKAKKETPRSVDLGTQIKTFDRAKLKKQTVYYMGLNGSSAHLPKTHGFVAVGTLGSSEQKGFGQVYQARQLKMHVPFIVSKELVEAARKSKKISKDTKEVIQELEGRQFQYAELFLRELFTRIAVHKKIDITKKEEQQKILMRAVNTSDVEVRELITLNNQINKMPSVILPGMTSGDQRDRDAFEKGVGVVAKPHSHIDAMAVREVYRQQQLFARYMDEKAGIGEATDMEEKMKYLPAGSAKPGASALVSYKKIPDSDDMFSANCNKAAASLLQNAEDLTAAREKRPSRPVQDASAWSVGSSQRMFLWDPLKVSLKGITLQMIGKTVLGKTELEKQSLANNKRNILKIISSLPTEKQMQALKEILNPLTALGQVFYAKRTGNWRNPALGRGYLQQAQEMLDGLAKQQAVKRNVK